jgi:hypothetical protein
MIIAIILAFCAIYILFMSCLWTPHTVCAAIVCKFIPYCCSIALLVCAMNEIGWIQIF